MSTGAGILATGAVSPVGASSAQTCAALRAGLSGFRASPVTSPDGEPLTLGLVPDGELDELPAGVETGALSSRYRRVLRLAMPALDEVLAGAQNLVPPPVYLAAPERHYEDERALDASFFRCLADGVGQPFDVGASTIFTGGAAGVFEAMRAAVAAITAGQPAVVVGGADSYLDLKLLAYLDRDARLQTDTTLDGFLGGEGAGFLLLTGNAQTAGVEVLGVGAGEEPGHRGSDEPCRGDGLTGAFAEAFANVEAEAPIGAVITGLTGESFGGKEWGIAATRHAGSLADDYDIEHLADRIGNAGAALAAISLVAGADLLARGMAAAPVAIWGTSEGVARGAAVLRRSGGTA